LWATPNNHPYFGDSVEVHVLTSHSDSVRVNGKLMVYANFKTRPVFNSFQYVSKAFG